MKYYIGVDIGLLGGISLIDEDKKLIECVAIPTLQVLVGKKIRNQYDISATDKIIKDLMYSRTIAFAATERLRAIPHQATQTAFSMGGGAILFKTLFIVNKIPFVEYEPRQWQKEIFGNLGVQYTSKTTKKASIQAAKQLWPGENFKRTERSRVDDDGLTDSACIALYCLLKNK